MLIFTKTSELEAHLSEQKGQNKTLGFVPTMGALHEGHLSLIKASKSATDITICSIFVNPTQFNDKSDLERYPRMPEIDTEMLKKAQCDILFIPSVDEVYKGQETPRFDFGLLGQILEGEHRPGHFDGVAQVVKRLFEIVQPDQAFFGSKDYQQVMIVNAMVKLAHLKVKVVPCPIVREADGLAMSSRNALLSPAERDIAATIPVILNEGRDIAREHSVGASKMHVINRLKEIEKLKLEYYEICDAETLLPISHLTEGEPAISLIAVFVGKIRLIDNLSLN